MDILTIKHLIDNIPSSFKENVSSIFTTALLQSVIAVDKQQKTLISFISDKIKIKKSYEYYQITLFRLSVSVSDV